MGVDYATGVVSAHDAERIERHAAECARCEARLMLLTASAAHDVALHFAPAVPESLREATLTAVAAAHRSRERTTRWRAVAAIVTAAAVIVIVVARRAPQGSPSVASSDAAADAISTGSVGASMLRVAEHLAQEQARAEFAALDAAAAELDAALARTPADVELRAYRAAVQARRNELAQRVRDVTL